LSIIYFLKGTEWHKKSRRSCAAGFLPRKNPALGSGVTEAYVWNLTNSQQCPAIGIAQWAETLFGDM